MNTQSTTDISRGAPTVRLVLFAFAALAVVPLAFPTGASAQNREMPRVSRERAAASNVDTSQPPQLVRTTTRREVRRFGFGNALVLHGAPEGSITIETWSRPEVEIVADIELRASSEEDLARLATVDNFILDEDTTRLRILTTGTHDRKFMRRVAKNFPKNLLGSSFKIDYHLRIPTSADIEINNGHGDLDIAGIEGALQLNVPEGDVRLALSGGDVAGTIGRGSVTVLPGTRSWRGRGLELRVATGDINLQLPAGFNTDLTATVLGAGRIENSYGDPTPFTITNQSPSSSSHAAQTSAATPPNQTTASASERTLRGRFGTGGAEFKLTVGTGTLRITPAKTTEK